MVYCDAELKARSHKGYLALVTQEIEQSIKILQCKEQRQYCLYKKIDRPASCLKCKRGIREFLLDEEGIVAVGSKVKAGDIKTDSSLKVANPELVLTYLNKGAKLDVNLEIESGVGYSVAEERQTGEIGLIPLDAAFSPITRVKYEVEETRVGRLTNYDKLILEIWTDGTIDPREAVMTSAKTLVAYFNQIVTPKKVKEEAKKEVDVLGPTAKLSVEEIGLPTRVANALIKAGHETVEDLIKAKREDLVRVRNLGEKSVKIIEAALGEKGISFTK